MLQEVSGTVDGVTPRAVHETIRHPFHSNIDIVEVTPNLVASAPVGRTAANALQKFIFQFMRIAHPNLDIGLLQKNRFY